MSFRSRLRTVLVCVVLEVGALSGVPMRPQDVEALVRAMRQPHVGHALPSDSEDRGEAGQAGGLQTSRNRRSTRRRSGSLVAKSIARS